MGYRIGSLGPDTIRVRSISCPTPDPIRRSPWSRVRVLISACHGFWYRLAGHWQAEACPPPSHFRSLLWSECSKRGQINTPRQVCPRRDTHRDSSSVIYNGTRCPPSVALESNVFPSALVFFALSIEIGNTKLVSYPLDCTRWVYTPCYRRKPLGSVRMSNDNTGLSSATSGNVRMYPASFSVYVGHVAVPASHRRGHLCAHRHCRKG